MNISIKKSSPLITSSCLWRMMPGVSWSSSLGLWCVCEASCRACPASRSGSVPSCWVSFRLSAWTPRGALRKTLGCFNFTDVAEHFHNVLHLWTIQTSPAVLSLLGVVYEAPSPRCVRLGWVGTWWGRVSPAGTREPAAGLGRQQDG